MVKHNNAIANNHFRKDWQRFVKTWFNQPAKKAARRQARVEKAKKLYPRPVDNLRPIVRGQTNKYNTKTRLGKGFSLVELKAAGISPKRAPGLAISVDHRRRNISEEGLKVNVDRLKAYLEKVVLLKKGAKITNYVQPTGQVVAAPVAEKTVEFHEITEEQRKFKAFKTLRRAHLSAKHYGKQEVRLARQAADKVAADKKAAKKATE